MSLTSEQPISAGPGRLYGQAPIEPDQVLPLDITQLRRRCMGNVAFADQLLDSFEARFPVDLANVEQLLAAKESARLTILVHQMKGAATNMSANVLGMILSRIEGLCRVDKLEEVGPSLAQLHQQWQRFIECRRAVG